MYLSSAVCSSDLSFFVTPRIADIPEIEEFLRETVPEVRYVVAHGQMSATEVEDRMSAFYDRKYEVLVSTTIVESGIDIPSANTLVIHRSEEHTSELQSLMRISYAVFCLKKKKHTHQNTRETYSTT